jgi:hypothetical protein
VSAKEGGSSSGSARQNPHLNPNPHIQSFVSTIFLDFFEISHKKIRAKVNSPEVDIKKKLSGGYENLSLCPRLVESSLPGGSS